MLDVGLDAVDQIVVCFDYDGLFGSYASRYLADACQVDCRERLKRSRLRGSDT